MCKIGIHNSSPRMEHQVKMEPKNLSVLGEKMGSHESNYKKLKSLLNMCNEVVGK